jgi:hypothetical protein
MRWLLASALLVVTPSVAHATTPTATIGVDGSAALGARLALVADVALVGPLTVGAFGRAVAHSSMLSGSDVEHASIGGGGSLTLRVEAADNSIPFITFGAGYVHREVMICQPTGWVTQRCPTVPRADGAPLYAVTIGSMLRPRRALLFGVTATFEYAGRDWLFVGFGLRVAAALGGS